LSDNESAVGISVSSSANNTLRTLVSRVSARTRFQQLEGLLSSVACLKILAQPAASRSRTGWVDGPSCGVETGCVWVASDAAICHDLYRCAP